MPPQGSSLLATQDDTPEEGQWSRDQLGRFISQLVGVLETYDGNSLIGARQSALFGSGALHLAARGAADLGCVQVQQRSEGVTRFFSAAGVRYVHLLPA